MFGGSNEDERLGHRCDAFRLNRGELQWVVTILQLETYKTVAEIASFVHHPRLHTNISMRYSGVINGFNLSVLSKQRSE